MVFDVFFCLPKAHLENNLTRTVYKVYLMYTMEFEIDAISEAREFYEFKTDTVCANEICVFKRCLDIPIQKTPDN